MSPQEMNDTGSAIIEKVLFFLNDRGFDNWWGGIDENTQEEIKTGLIEAISDQVRGAYEIGVAAALESLDCEQK